MTHVKTFISMVQTGNNCGCPNTQVATKANYINVNGKQVISQYFSKGQGKMVYAHKDPSGIGGVVYKPYKPGNSPYQQKTNKPDAYSGNSRPSNQYRAPVKDRFQQQQQNSYRLVPIGRDRYGRMHYRKQVVQTNRVQQAQPRTTQKLAFQKIPGSNKLKLTLPPGANISLAAERNGGKEAGARLTIKNETHKNMDGYAIRSYRSGHQNAPKNLEIIASPNRHKDYDYSVVYYENGKRKEEKLRLPSKNSPYNRKENNSRAYKLRSGGSRYTGVTFGYDDSRDQSLKGRRASTQDLQPKTIALRPGEQVSNIRPKGLKGDSVTVTIGDTKYEVSNEDEKQFAYIVYRKQADGSRKPFYRTDSRQKDLELEPKSLFSRGLSFKEIGKVKTATVEEAQLEKDKASDPFVDDLSVADAIKDLEVISPILDSEEVKDFKKAKNALRSEVQNNPFLDNDQSARISKLLGETSYSPDLSLAEKMEIIESLSKQVDTIKAEDSGSKEVELKSKPRAKTEDEKWYESVFGKEDSKEVKAKEEEKYKGSIITKLNPDELESEPSSKLRDRGALDWLNKQPNLDQVDPFGELQLIPESKDGSLEQLMKDFPFESLPKTNK